MVHTAPATQRPWKTVDDYLAVADDVRAELIDGELHVTPAPTRRHQEVIENLHLLLATHVRQRDLIVKRSLYARNGVPAYWLVHPEDGAIEALRLEGPAYGPEAYFTGGNVLTTPRLPGLALPLPEVFR